MCVLDHYSNYLFHYLKFTSFEFINNHLNYSVIIFYSSSFLHCILPSHLKMSGTNWVNKVFYGGLECNTTGKIVIIRGEWSWLLAHFTSRCWILISFFYDNFLIHLQSMCIDKLWESLWYLVFIYFAFIQACSVWSSFHFPLWYLHKINQ